MFSILLTPLYDLSATKVTVKYPNSTSTRVCLYLTSFSFSLSQN